MGTGIEWATETLNPVFGCSRVSDGCANCYAATMARRLATMLPGGDYGKVVRRRGGQPIAEWSGHVALDMDVMRKAAAWRKPRRIFMASMGDIFHQQVPVAFLAELYQRMAVLGRHTFLLLTKRPELARIALSHIEREHGLPAWPLPNVWLGTSVEHQPSAARITDLLKCPAAGHFVSMEPLLGPVTLPQGLVEFPGRTDTMRLTTANALGDARISWVIVGAETGAGARPMNPEWARSLRDQTHECKAAFFMKKMGPGGKPPIPSDLMIREFPKGMVV